MRKTTALELSVDGTAGEVDAMPKEPSSIPLTVQVVTPSPLEPRPRPAISLRVIMVFLLAIGGWLGWFLYRVHVERGAADTVKKAGGTVVYELQQPEEDPGGTLLSSISEWAGSVKKMVPTWLIDRIGPDYFGSVIEVTLAPPAADDPTRVEAALAVLSRFDRLRDLHLNGVAVTDRELARLEGLTRLRNLDLARTPITDAGLVHLKGLVGLQTLGLAGTNVTDAGLAHLSGLKGLWGLSFAGTAVTDDGLFELEQSLPALKIYRREEMAYSSARPRAVRDLEFARSRPIRLACLLLAFRVQATAYMGDEPELKRTIDALCGLNPSDNVGRLKLACACAESIEALDSPRVINVPDDDRRAMQERCANRAVGALALAVDRGFNRVLHLEYDSTRPELAARFAPQLDALRDYPGFKELVEKVKAVPGGHSQ
jgi:hypothetical protein